MINPMNVVQLLKDGNAPIDMDYFKNDIDSSAAGGEGGSLAGMRLPQSPGTPYELSYYPKRPKTREKCIRVFEFSVYSLYCT